MRSFFTTKGNFRKYVLPSVVVFALFVGYTMATNLQSWQADSGSTVAAIDTGGGLTISGSGGLNLSFAGTTTITGGSMAGGTVIYAPSGVVTAGTLSAGTLAVFEPMQGNEYKQMVFSGSGVTATGNTLQITFPTPFVVGAGTLCNNFTGNNVNAGLPVTANSTTATLTVSATAATGVFILGGR